MQVAGGGAGEDRVVCRVLSRAACMRGCGCGCGRGGAKVFCHPSFKAGLIHCGVVGCGRVVCQGGGRWIGRTGCSWVHTCGMIPSRVGGCGEGARAGESITSARTEPTRVVPAEAMLEEDL